MSFPEQSQTSYRHEVCRYDSKLVLTITKVNGLSTPGAFNAGIVDDGKKIVMAYRPRMGRNSIGFATLNCNFEPVPGGVYETDWNGNDDPRLFQHPELGILLMTNYWCPHSRIELRRMKWDDIGHLVEAEHLGKFDLIENFPGYTKRCEKNWMPFVHNGEIYFVYSVHPHRILKYNLAKRSVELAYIENWNIPETWHHEWGVEFRGSSQPVRLNDGTYLTTWHTYKTSGYWTGFYIFDGKPPFRPLRFSAFPVLTPNLATGHNPYNSRHGCIFICGMLVEEEKDSVILTGGDNDKAVVAIKMSLSRVLSQLVPVR